MSMFIKHLHVIDMAAISEFHITTVIFRYLQLMDEQDQIERDLRYLLEMKGF